MILCPLLFIVFINDVFQFNSASSEIYLYADDTAIISNAKSNSALQFVIDAFFNKCSALCAHNCIVVYPIKVNYLSFIADNIVLTINGQSILRTNVAKYLGLYIDDELAWKQHVALITKSCSQKIGVFKKFLYLLSEYVLSLYYNAFIRSSFSFCLMFLINDDRSGRYKLINKIDNLLVVIRKRFNNSQMDDSVVMYDVWAVYKLQCVSFMYDIFNNNVCIPFFSLVLNNIIHGHYTLSSANVHINTFSTLDYRNFVYHSTLCWNDCPQELRMLSKSKFLSKFRKCL